MNYSICGVPLCLRGTAQSEPRLQRVLNVLFSLVPLDPALTVDERGICIRIRPAEEPAVDGVRGEVVFEAPGLTAMRTAYGYHLESRGSFLRVDLRSGRAEGRLSSGFLNAPPEDQRGLWVFALLLLLSGKGAYGLHAAGVSCGGCGVLIAGSSGSGKTTLTCALVRSGWNYLSDDAVLLRRGRSGRDAVEALAFGRRFHCTTSLLRFFPEFGRDSQPSGYGKRLVDVSAVYPGQARSSFIPRVVVFAEITSAPVSCLVPLDQTATLLRLMREGAGFLHDRGYMAGQMEILGNLARSVRGFRLLHGADVHANPAQVSRLLRQAAAADLNSQLRGVPGHAIRSAA